MADSSICSFDAGDWKIVVEVIDGNAHGIPFRLKYMFTPLVYIKNRILPVLHPENGEKREGTLHKNNAVEEKDRKAGGRKISVYTVKSMGLMPRSE